MTHSSFCVEGGELPSFSEWGHFSTELNCNGHVAPVKLHRVIVARSLHCEANGFLVLTMAAPGHKRRETSKGACGQQAGKGGRGRGGRKRVGGERGKGGRRGGKEEVEEEKGRHKRRRKRPL